MVEITAKNVRFLAAKDWKRVMSPASIKRINLVAMRAALSDWQTRAIPLRFTKGTPAKTRVTWRTLFNRAREAFRTKRKLAGAPDLVQYYRQNFDDWDPWSRSFPPLKLVKRRNSALLSSKSGGYASSRYDEWTRASKDYRAWAKTKTRKWLQSLVGSASFVPLVLSGELRAVAGTGKINVTSTKDRVKGELSIPRAGRQNKQVSDAFGGDGKSPVVSTAEMKRIETVIGETILRELQGKASVIPAKKGR